MEDTRSSIPCGRLEPPDRAQALVFDCDGTLVHTLQAQLASWTAAFADFGAEMAPSWYRARTSLNAMDLISAMAGESGLTLDHDEVLSSQIDAYLANIDLVSPNEPVISVARKYRGRVPLAVASNGSRALVTGTLEAAGILDLFDVLVAAEDVRQGKPAPDAYLFAARRLAVPAPACVAYEDTDGGMRAATAAGMRVIDVREAVPSTEVTVRPVEGQSNPVRSAWSEG